MKDPEISAAHFDYIKKQASDNPSSNTNQYRTSLNRDDFEDNDDSNQDVNPDKFYTKLTMSERKERDLKNHFTE